MDCSPLGSSAYGIFQARILKWVAISFSRGLPNPGIELKSLVSPALAGRFFTTSTAWETRKAGTVRVKPVREVQQLWYREHLPTTTSLGSGFADMDLTAGAAGL